MNRYIILPHDRDMELVREYLIDNGLDIPLENVLRVEDFHNRPDYPALLFLVKYSEKREEYFNVACKNKRLKGLNVSIAGDASSIIDFSMQEAVVPEMKRIISISAGYKRRVNKTPRAFFINVSSSSGGVGKSLLSLNLARMIQSKFKSKKVILLDAAHNNRTVSKHFLEDARVSLDEVARRFENFAALGKEEDFITKSATLVATQQRVEFDLIFAFKKIDENAHRSRFFLSIFEMLSSKYDFVIIDSTTEKSSPIKSAIEEFADLEIFLFSSRFDILDASLESSKRIFLHSAFVREEREFLNSLLERKVHEHAYDPSLKARGERLDMILDEAPQLNGILNEIVKRREECPSTISLQVQS